MYSVLIDLIFLVDVSGSCMYMKHPAAFAKFYVFAALFLFPSFVVSYSFILPSFSIFFFSFLFLFLNYQSFKKCSRVVPASPLALFERNLRKVLNSSSVCPIRE